MPDPFQLSPEERARYDELDEDQQTEVRLAWGRLRRTLVDPNVGKFVVRRLEARTEAQVYAADDRAITRELESEKVVARRTLHRWVKLFDVWFARCRAKYEIFRCILVLTLTSSGSLRSVVQTGRT